MRIALVTQRSVQKGTGQFPAYGAWTEAEDVLIDTVGADLIPLSLPIEDPRIRFRRQTGRAARSLLGDRLSLPANPAARSALKSLSGHYDAIIFVAHSVWDLQLLERLGNLRKLADCVAVWFLETWPSSLVNTRQVKTEPFHAVDRIFVGMDGAVEPLANAIDREVTYLPLASNVTRFGPDLPDTERPIDLIGIGRRRQEQHEGMLRWAADTGRLYLYDSVKVSRPADLNAHRDTIGGWYRSSKLATCNFAKSDEPAIVGPHRMMPGRLWEGLAAGAGLVGVPPSATSQRELFGRTVVEAMPDDPLDLPMFLEEQIERHGPEQTAANVRLALTGHDWAHRWAALLDELGYGSPPGLEQRIASLAERAEKFR
ncbi:MAG: hypothetical protein AAF531_26810 [Actinomycetota bacterium]